jgi:putative membrane protein
MQSFDKGVCNLKIKKIIMSLINGFCMALADSVPGVSGGTVAFLMGFYDDFIGALNDLLIGNWAAKKKALFYLIKLGVGWIIGFGASVLVLSSVFESHIYHISSLFIGFILFAIPIVVYEERKCLRAKPLASVMLLIGAGAVAMLTYFTAAGENNALTLESLQMQNLTLGTCIYVFIAGAIAICAMVLPGISGSTLLLIFGLYIAIISAVKEFMTLNFDYFPILCIFGLGVVTGIVSIVRLIRIALEKWRSFTVYLILGMMLGSLYSVVMGPTTLDTPQEMLTPSTFRILFFLIGAVLIIGLQLLGVWKGKKQS